MVKLREFDLENDYGVFYMRGIICIVVNKKFVKDYLRDYIIYNREDLVGRMIFLDDMREVFVFVLVLNGYK